MKQIKLYSFLLIFLFLLAPFVMSVTDSREGINVLPESLLTIASISRWCVLIIISAFTIKEKLWNRVNRIHLFVVAFYIVQVIYSLLSQTDVIRYLGLSITSCLVPFFIAYVINENPKILLHLKFIVYILIALSLIININMFFVYNLRFQGFLNNSNLYGAVAVFWFSYLLFVNEKVCKKFNSLDVLFLFVLIFSIVLSGSRNALIGLITVLLFNIKSLKKKNIFSFILALVLLVVMLDWISYNFLLEHEVGITRVFNIKNSVTDSGRSTVWNLALYYISLNPFGYGMNAPMELIKTGNIHNCYIRYLLSMGVIFTVGAFVFYFIYLLKVYFEKNEVSKSLLGFLFAYTLMNFGEDYFVGLGSIMYIYFLFVLGLNSACLKCGCNENTSNK